MKLETHRVDEFLDMAALGVLLGSVESAVKASIQPELRPLYLTVAQFVAFNEIAPDGSTTIGELCRVVGYDSGAMTRLIDRIEEKELIRRVINPRDRRSYRLELTPLGRGLLPAARVRVRAAIARLMGGISANDATGLQIALKRILANAADAH